MATLGAQSLTLSDWKKRLAPDGSIDFIVEALENSNPIIQDIVWKEGNLPTGNRTTVRASIPVPSVRHINQGVDRHKSTTRQVQDTCIILEDRSVVDIEAVALAPDKEQFRRSEDAAFVAGFSDAVASNIFYGNTDDTLDQFNGLSMRYDIIGGDKNDAGYQVLSGGTPNEAAKNTSAWFVGWGSHATTGIFPKNSQAGLKMRDLGEMSVHDAEGREYQALATLFTWKVGMAVQDIRANAAVRNIDAAKIDTLSGTAKGDLIKQFIKAKNRIRNLQNRDKNVVLYVSDSVYDFFELYLLDKNNVHVTRQDVMGAAPQLYLSGIPIKKCDAITETEAAVATKE